MQEGGISWYSWVLEKVTQRNQEGNGKAQFPHHRWGYEQGQNWWEQRVRNLPGRQSQHHLPSLEVQDKCGADVELEVLDGEEISSRTIRTPREKALGVTTDLISHLHKILLQGGGSHNP